MTPTPQQAEQELPPLPEQDLFGAEQMRAYAREAVRAALASQTRAVPEYRLFDSQWVNVVNHPSVLNENDAVEAVSIAVRLAEAAMARNIDRNEWPCSRAALAAAPTPSTKGESAMLAASPEAPQ